LGHLENKIAIVHYRVGRTDGVSLEIEKRKTILESLGYKVRLISGPVQSGADFIIDELEFDAEEILDIKEQSFQYFNHPEKNPTILMNHILEVSEIIENKFLDYHKKEQFSAVLIHNIFSLGSHIAAAAAFTRIADKTKIPFISTNHDYYWEREQYQEPTSEDIKHFLNEFVPPSRSNIQHVSINSLGRTALLEKRKIDSIVFPDIFDFDQPLWEKDEFNADFRDRFNIKENDIVILQATRIVARKAIEIAVDLVAELDKLKTNLAEHTLYNGRVTDPTSEIIFVLAGYAEESESAYLSKLKAHIKSTGIHARFIHNSIAYRRSKDENNKVYSLWDAYVHADLVTYPSIIEGWGNQFIEAVFALCPVVLFEYPVFKSDIKHEGYSYVSLGDTFHVTNSGLAKIENKQLTKSAHETISVLTNTTNTPLLLKKNSAIGEQYHGYQVLRSFLEQAVKKNI
jgi:glycosyltransferase involved in cell wall biosynthesis